MSIERTVLIVEDFPDNREFFATVLRLHGYHVLEAGDGEAALALAADARPDLILMDLNLPVMDGWTAARRLKADPALKQIPVVALTAHAVTGDNAGAADAGCDEVVAKPVLPRQLLGAVERRLRPRAA